MTRLRVLAVLLLVVMWSCGAEGEGGNEQRGTEGGLHECAQGFAVPEGIRVLDSSEGQAGDGTTTCVVSLHSPSSLGATADVLETGLSGAGIELLSERGGEGSFHMRMEGPVCGVVLGFPASTPGVVEDAPDEGSIVVVSILPCDRMPPREPPRPESLER